MANTYSQLHVHLVFAVKYRRAMIGSAWKERLHQFVSGVIRQNGHKVLQVNSMPDHIHIFIGQRPNQSLSELVKLIKSGTTKWVNQNGFCDQRFAWQEGFGAFSYSKSQVKRVVLYIVNQENHHRRTGFREEYMSFLQKREIEFDEKYIFLEPE